MNVSGDSTTVIADIADDTPHSTFDDKVFAWDDHRNRRRLVQDLTVWWGNTQWNNSMAWLYTREIVVNDG